MHRPILGLVAKNLALAVLTFLVFLTAWFLYLKMSVGHLTNLYTRDSRLSPGATREISRLMDLDQPSLPREYLAFIKNAFTGNWGLSFPHYPRPVRQMVEEHLPRSLLLFGLALLVALPSSRAVSLLFYGERRARWKEASRLLALAGISIFLPLWVILAQHIFAYRLGWLPASHLLEPALWRAHADTNVNALFLRLVSAAFVSLLLSAVSFFCVSSLRRLRRWPYATPVGALLVGGLVFGGTFASLLHLSGATGATLLWDLTRHLLLPWATLALFMTALSALLLHGHFLVSRPWPQNFPSRALFLALSLGALVGTEALYAWPGVGYALINAYVLRDLPFIYGAFLVSVVLLIALHSGMHIGIQVRTPALDGPSTIEGAQEASPFTLKLALACLLPPIGMAVLHPLLMNTIWKPATYDPLLGTDPNFAHPSPPSVEHPLGTDPWGRDILSQLLYGARSMLLQSAIAGALAVAVGLLMALAAYALERAGRWLRWASRILDLWAYGLIALPLLLMLLTLPTPVQLARSPPVWFGLLSWPIVFVLLRGRGGEDARPQLTPWGKRAAAGFCYVAALRLSLHSLLGYFGFSGLGYFSALGPQMDWGTILGGTRLAVGAFLAQDLAKYAWLLWPAGLAISLVTFGLFLLGWILKARAG